MTRNRRSTFAALLALPCAGLAPSAALASRDHQPLEAAQPNADDSEVVRHAGRHPHRQSEPAFATEVSYRTTTPYQIGIASWYGGQRWQGNRTSSGERYDENRLTAAHASLPLGSMVRVTLVDTAQSVVVTITDRPGTRRRVIDLSRRAAAALGMIDRGVAEVSLQPL